MWEGSSPKTWARPPAVIGPAHSIRPRPPLLQRGIVEERIRIRVEQLMRERRRLTAIQTDQLNLPRLDVAEHAQEAIQIGDFVQTVVHRLANNGLIGHLDVADDVLL